VTAQVWEDLQLTTATFVDKHGQVQSARIDTQVDAVTAMAPTATMRRTTTTVPTLSMTPVEINSYSGIIVV